MESPFLTYFLVQMRRLTGCRGQGSLEYIAIAVVLVVLVIIAFKFLGGQLISKSESVGGDINAPNYCVENPNAAACK